MAGITQQMLKTLFQLLGRSIHPSVACGAMSKSSILPWQSRLCRDRQALRLAALATAPLIGEPLGERHYAAKLPFICRSIDHPQCVAAASTPPPCDTEHEQMAPWTAPLCISGKNCFASETNLSSKLVQLKAQSFRPNSRFLTSQTDTKP